MLAQPELEARRWDGYRGLVAPQLLGSWAWPGALLQAGPETRMRGAMDGLLNRLPFWYSVRRPHPYLPNLRKSGDCIDIMLKRLPFRCLASRATLWRASQDAHKLQWPGILHMRGCRQPSQETSVSSCVLLCMRHSHDRCCPDNAAGEDLQGCHLALRSSKHQVSECRARRCCGHPSAYTRP